MKACGELGWRGACWVNGTACANAWRHQRASILSWEQQGAVGGFGARMRVAFQQDHASSRVKDRW